MHILSKILLGLALALAIVAIYPMSQLAQKRNALTEQVVQQKKLRDENIAKIAQANITRQREVDELNRLMDSWGRQWSVKGQTDGQQPSYVVNVGVNNGLAAQETATKRPAPVVNLFAVTPEGSRYLGEFVVAQSGPQQTLLTLNRPAYPDEVASWPQQGDFRIRERVPPGVRAQFLDLVTHQAIADQQVINEEAKLAIQDKHIAASQKTLENRLAELNGDPAAPQTADPEIIHGLVETLRTEEAARNKVLADVDALRRSLSAGYARLQQLLADNKQRVDAMTPTVGAETASASPVSAN